MSSDFSDDLLAAYVDGELSDAERTRIEQAIARDARLAQRVAQQRALRGRLRNVFDGSLRESVSQRLVNAARHNRVDGPAQIIDLARVRAARARRSERPRIEIPRRAVVGLTLALLLGIGFGLLAEHLLLSSRPTEYRDGSLVASGLLNRALNEQLSSAVPGSSAVRISLSFHARSGSYCRTFALDGSTALTGLACREQDHWRILTLLSSEVRTAGAAMPPLLVQAVNEHINGERLDASAEERARRAGWH